MEINDLLVFPPMGSMCLTMALMLCLLLCRDSRDERDRGRDIESVRKRAREKEEEALSGTIVVVPFESMRDRGRERE